MDKENIPVVFKKFMLILIAALFGIVLFAYLININKQMTLRQKILKVFYPMLTGVGKMTGSNAEIISNEKSVKPKVPFHELSFTLNDGSNRQMSFFKGKKILIVNTASNCGYTHQYDELQKLYETNQQQLVVIGFPANDFKEQEKGTDEEIQEFCRINYGVNFPLSKKTTVIKNGEQHPVYQWLSHRDQNGWCGKAPVWNFSKYLVNEDGMLTHYFGPAVEPMDEVIVNAIKN